jgi:NADPH:quinone reductase-like Zn-dependent oxidoreductase
MRSRHVSVTRIGGLETLELRTADVAEPGPGEVLVRVSAAGISYGDLLLRLGVIPFGPKPPFTPGFDIAGVVEKTGPAVSEFAVGQPVVALVRAGGYSDHVVVPANRLVALPNGVDPVDAAASALNYFIAQQMLHRIAEVRAGQRILVHGASGGVGIAFLQLAQLAGIACYGTASAANRDVVTSHGGIPIDYRTEDFVQVIRSLPGGGVHAVFDPIGGGHFNRSSSVLRRGGIMVAYGQSAALVDNKANMLVGARGMLGGIFLPKLVPNGRRTTFYNAWSLEKSQPTAYRNDLAGVMRLLAEGRITPPIAKTMPLERAADAQQLLEQGSVRGKVVLTTH